MEWYPNPIGRTETKKSRYGLFSLTNKAFRIDTSEHPYIVFLVSFKTNSPRKYECSQNYVQKNILFVKQLLLIFDQRYVFTMGDKSPKKKEKKKKKAGKKEAPVVEVNPS